MKTSKKLIFIACLLAAILLLSAQASHAASATWNLNPGSGDWQTATNWTPITVPNGPADTATFALSNTTGASLSANTQVNGIVFNAGASAFTITASPTFQLTISGVGITNNSGIGQSLVTAVAGANIGSILFTNGATAGNGTFFTNTGGAASGADGGNVLFFNSSAAGNGTFTNNGGTVSGAGFAGIQFFNTSAAGSGTFTNNGPTVSGAGYGYTNFNDSTTAGNGSFTNNGGTVSGEVGGVTGFNITSTAGNGSFTNNGGTVSGAGGGFTPFYDSSTASNASVTNNGGVVSGAFPGVTYFNDTSSAGNGIFANNGGLVSGLNGGVTQFNITSTAGNGSFTNNGGTVNGAGGGFTEFNNTSTAGSGTFTNNGAPVSGAGGGSTFFHNTSSASNAIFVNYTGTATILDGGGGVVFFETSTAGQATFTSEGATGTSTSASYTHFRDSSTAGNGTVTANGSTVVDGIGAFTGFYGTSTAANGVLTANGGAIQGANRGHTDFFDNSTAGNATLIANGGPGNDPLVGGVIRFRQDSTGGTARVEVFGNGNLDISGHNAPGVTIGSLEGSGGVFLGIRNLTVGSNNLNTTFSGVIQNGGSFTKIGSGTLSLTSTNTYTGGTVISAGILQASQSGALGGGNVSLINSGATLTLQGGATNNYIADTATLSVVSGSTVNLNFSGNADTVGSLIVNGVLQPACVYGSAASGAPCQLPVFAGTGTIQVVAPSTPTPTPTATPTPAPPVITSPLVTTGTVGLPFSYQFEASGATSLAVSNLPPGLTFNTSLRAITGIPTTAGIFQVGLSATNSGGTTNRTLTITVQTAPSGLVIISSTCATARTGRAFSFQLQTSGGSSATRFTVDSLPPGLNLDPSTGFISGTPTSDGSFSLAVSAIDGTAITQATLQLTFTSDPTVPIITSPGTAILTPGQFFSYTITADANGTFGYIGTDGIVHQGPSSAGLPAGLSFDGIDTISGIFNPPFGHDAGPNTISGLSGGIVTNVQLFRIGDGGTGTFPLITFIAAAGTVNISTRLAVGTGNNVLIGGFIITGTGTTRALIRAIGPSLMLPPFNISGALQDPMLTLKDANGMTLGANDDWRDSQENAIIAVVTPSIAPTDSRESAILAFLSPGPYTAIVSGKNNTTGIALVEVYDLGMAAPLPPDYAKLANISTRGFVETGDNVIIGGFIILPQAPATSTRVVLRAIGPSLTQFGIPNALANPTLELRDGNGMLLVANNDWQDDPAQAAELTAAGLAPTNQLESGIAATLPQGPCTAIVRGIDNTTGVALVEVYALP